ncbi:hypothetical protein EXIGLDRAFT_309345 [Exidia glandulosa HHB12029]|uniref:Uncharacterized protein n=1 Tax=Exidia glandulosa HHB12029 TaxID=1314781 RepID=A0A165D193_EXIGL|nr:hypothetical protein EXIGLDRAFT_309345 [Exidia glandulosa HHB12029]
MRYFWAASFDALENAPPDHDADANASVTSDRDNPPLSLPGPSLATDQLGNHSRAPRCGFAIARSSRSCRPCTLPLVISSDLPSDPATTRKSPLKLTSRTLRGASLTTTEVLIQPDDFAMIYALDLAYCLSPRTSAQLRTRPFLTALTLSVNRPHHVCETCGISLVTRVRSAGNV